MPCPVVATPATILQSITLCYETDDDAACDNRRTTEVLTEAERKATRDACMRPQEPEIASKPIMPEHID